MNHQILLQTKQIDKSFGRTKALVGVDFSLCSGEIHGLIGENGSGKSTLSSIIAGAQSADKGSMEYKGRPYLPSNSLEANANGICMLLQEKGTFDGISVASNIFVGKEAQFSKNRILRMGDMYKKARIALDYVGAMHINERTKNEALIFEDQKLVEIAKAMENQPDLLIVDETTTALSRNGRDKLYQVMRNMRDEGKSVIFISHDIDEIQQICDTITVLRDGNMVATLKKDEFSDDIIRELMIGREISSHFYRSDMKATSINKTAIRAENICTSTLKNVSFEVDFGEIVGFGGLTDCGMHELGKVLFGRVKPQNGRVVLHDGTGIRSSITATKHKVGYVSKNRDEEALVLNASILDNVCAPSLKKLRNKIGLVTARSEKEFANKWSDVLSVKRSHINQPVIHLSGGNKQKVSVAKWLGFDTDIIIFDCPTRGIDIGVKTAIYDLLSQLKEAGKAIIMISEELIEVIGMSDRIIILKDGRISGEFIRDEQLTESKLISYII